MSSPVTECAYIGLKPDVDINGDTPEAQIWKDTINTISQQEGYQSSYWGRQMQREDMLMLYINWDSLASHQKFIDSAVYGPFLTNVKSITTSLTLHHFAPSLFPPSKPLSSPCTEICTFFHTKPTFPSNVSTFLSALDRGQPFGYLGSVFGEVVEEIAKEDTDGSGKEGKKGKAVKLCIGWTSKEEHMKFRETELFRENIWLLREKQEGAELFHVQFNAV